MAATYNFKAGCHKVCLPGKEETAVKESKEKGVLTDLVRGLNSKSWLV